MYSLAPSRSLLTTATYGLTLPALQGLLDQLSTSIPLKSQTRDKTSTDCIQGRGFFSLNPYRKQVEHGRCAAEESQVLLFSLISSVISDLYSAAFYISLTGGLHRLKALREAAADREGDDGPAPSAPALKFRNYNVRDQKIEHTVVEPAQPPKYEPPKPEVEVGKKPEVSQCNCCLLTVRLVSAITKWVH